MTSIHTNQPPKTAANPGREAEAAERRSFEGASAQTEKTAREAEAVIEKTAAASADAARANREILQRNAETAQDAVRSGLEAGAQGLHSLAETMSRTFGMTQPNPALAEQSAQNIRAFSEASTALARGTQEASRTWFDLVQSGVRANLEAFSQFTTCRSLQEVTALQSKLSREHLQRVIESGEQITRTFTQAISQASHSIQTDRPSGQA